MTEDERELLKQLCGAVGGISAALSDGAGIHDLQSVHRSITNIIGPLYERIYASSPANGNEAQK